MTTPQPSESLWQRFSRFCDSFLPPDETLPRAEDKRKARLLVTVTLFLSTGLCVAGLVSAIFGQGGTAKWIQIALRAMLVLALLTNLFCFRFQRSFYQNEWEGHLQNLQRPKGADLVVDENECFF